MFHILILIFLGKVISQESFHGLPFITNYSSDAYNSIGQTWDAVQDNRGVMFFGNTNGVLRFDGNYWRLQPISRFMSIVRSIEKSSDGTLYVGSIDNFGYLRPTKTGAFEYFSLSTSLPKDKASFNDIWQIACYKDLTVFMSSRYLFMYRNYQLFKIFEAKEKFTTVATVEGKLYMHENGSGLHVWVNDAFTLLQGGENFIGEHISFLTSHRKGSILVGTTKNKVFSIDDGRTMVWSNLSEIEDLNKITCCVVLHDKTLAIGTSGSGIIFLNQRGEVVRKIGLQEGLIGNGITNLYTDRHENLWVTTDNGISYVEVNSPFTYYMNSYGLTQPVMEAIFYNNQLYLAGIDAVYSMPYYKAKNPLHPLSFELINGTNGQSWSIKSNSGKLYIAHNPGLFTNDGAQLLYQPLNHSNVYDIVFPSSHPDKFIASVDNGLLLIDKSSFSFSKIWSGKETPRYLLIDRNEDIWMIPETLHGVYRLQLTLNFDSVKSIEWYGVNLGLPDQPVLSLINTSFGLSVLTAKGLYKYDKAKNIFDKDTSLKGIISPNAFLANTDDANNVWLGGMNYLAQLFREESGIYKIKEIVFRRTRSYTVFHSTLLPDSSWIFSTNKGLIRYDSTRDVVPKLYRPIINEIVSLAGDSGQFHREFFLGTHESDNLIHSTSDVPKIPYSGNSFRFQCASCCYIEAQQCEFRFRLDEDGSEMGNWSEWTKSPEKEYTNLSEGKYTFGVASRDVYGQVSPITTFEFEVLPPWYRSFWAYVGYVLLTIIVFFIGIKLNSLHLKRANNRLEKIISERTQKIERQKTEIQSLNEFKSRFYSNISHELRTPLTLIISPLELLESETDNPALRKSYGIMLRNAHRLLTLINQILELSKLEKGKVRSHPELAAIGPIIKQIVESFSQFASIRNIKLTFHEREPNIQLPFDQDIIEKILNNLLSNALKFTEPFGEVSVLLKLSDDREQACIIVSDTGGGIPEDEIPLIFDRFYQVDNSSRQKHEGIGIGLAFVKELVEIQNGNITVESSLKKGSSFSILLPLNPTGWESETIIHTSGDLKTEQPCHQSFASQEKMGDKKTLKNIKGKGTILIVEDNMDMQNFIADNTSAHYIVIKAKNGEEGLALALAEMPDLIITDVMMPRMNGYELTRAIKDNRLTSHIPVIILTAKTSEESKIEGLETLADDYLTKPFSIKELNARIANLIAIRNRLKRKYQDELLVNPSEVTTSALDEEFLSKAIKLVEDNFSNSLFSIKYLCDELAMSRPTLHRKLKALTNQSTSEFINSIRLKHAALLIRGKAGNISEIAYEVGFNNIPYFNVSFKKQFGVTPSEFK